MAGTSIGCARFFFTVFELLCPFCSANTVGDSYSNKMS